MPRTELQLTADCLIKRSLLVLSLTACLRSSREARDAAVLAPLASQLGTGFFDEGNQPVYVIFGDSLTAGVFRKLGRAGRYRIAPKDARLVCPSKKANGMQGGLLRVRVDQMMGDTALATMELICVMQLSDTTQAHRGGMQFAVMGNTMSMGVHILLVRVRGKWKVEKVISGFTSVLG